MTCPNGHAVAAETTTCTSCGAPTVDGNAPTAAADAPVTRSGRRTFAIAAVAAVAAIAIGAGAVATLRGDDPAALVVFSQGAEANRSGNLSLGTLDSEPAELQPFAEDAYLIPIRQLRSGHASVTVSDGGIVPVADGAIASWGGDDSGTTVGVVRTDGATEVLFRSDGYARTLRSSDGTWLLYQSSDGGSATCLAGPLDAAPEAVARGEACWFLPTDEVVTTTAEQGRTTITTYDLTGTELGSHSIDGRPEVDPSGTRLYADTSTGASIRELRSGAELLSVPGDGARVLGWSDHGAALYAGEDEEAARLAVLDPEGVDRTLLRGSGVTGDIAPDGRVVIAAERDADGVTLWRAPTNGDEPSVLLQRHDVDFRLLPGTTTSKVLAWDPGGLGVWLGDAATGELTRIGDLERGQLVTAIAYDEAEGTVLMATRSGRSISIWAASDKLSMLSTGWDHVFFERSAEGTTLARARAGGDETLLATDDGVVSELDVADGIEVVTTEGSSVVYTAVGDVDDPATAELRRAATDGDGVPEVLSEGMRILGSSAAADLPAITTIDANERSTRFWVGDFGSCDDGMNIDIADRAEAGTVDAAGRSFCILVPAGGADVSLSLTAEIPTRLRLTTLDGQAVGVSEGPTDAVHAIEKFLDQGTYLISVSPTVADDVGRFEITAEVRR